MKNTGSTFGASLNYFITDINPFEKEVRHSDEDAYQNNRYMS